MSREKRTSLLLFHGVRTRSLWKFCASLFRINYCRRMMKHFMTMRGFMHIRSR